MPNHTSNFVEIETNTGCSKEQLALAELKTKLLIHKGEFDFEGITPMPKDLAKSFDVHDPFDHGDEWENDMGHLVPSDELIRKRWIKEYGFDNWYDWALHNWDTKWDVDFELDFYDVNDCILLEFNSAWGPPLAVWQKFVDRYPKGTFEVAHLQYIESGMQFCGVHDALDNIESVHIEDYADTFADYASNGMKFNEWFSESNLGWLLDVLEHELEVIESFKRKEEEEEK